MASPPVAANRERGTELAQGSLDLGSHQRGHESGGVARGGKELAHLVVAGELAYLDGKKGRGAMARRATADVWP